MANENDIIVDFALNTKGAQEAIDKWVVAYDRAYKRLERATKQHTKKLLRPNKDMWDAYREAANEETKILKTKEHNIDKITKLYEKLHQAQEEQTNNRIKVNSEEIKVQRDLAETTEKQIKITEEAIKKFGKWEDATEDERKKIESLRAELETLQGTAKSASAAVKGAEDALKSSGASVQEIEKAIESFDKLDERLKAIQEARIKPIEFKWDDETLKAEVEEAGKNMSGAFSSALGKDAKGVAESLGSLVGKGAFATMRRLGARGMVAASKKVGPDGEAKGITKVLGGLSQFVNLLGRLEPAFALLGTGIMSLVKLFLDAEAAAKDFQREILSTSSTMELLGKNAGNVRNAASDLGETLQGVRDAAFDLSNAEWGLKKEDYTTTMSNLTSQGYTLAQLKKDAGDTYEGVKDLTQETVHLAVAYSRNMGVSLQEVTQLQGELMGQLGMNLDQVKSAFGQMSAEAEASQVPANQFFNIIRAMSADMSLFNNRMDSAAKLLGKVMKVMNPKKAQEFVQSLMGFYKNQDLMSRVRHVLLGSGKTQQILQADIDVKMEGLADDLAKKGINEADLRSAVSGGMKTTTEFLAKNADKLSAEEKNAIIEAAQQQAKVSSGDTIELASALKDASPIAAMKQMDDEAKTRFGKSIDELRKVNRLAAEQLGYTEKFQEDYGKFKVSLDLTRAEIAQRIEQGTATQDDMNVLTKLGIKAGTKEEQAQAIRDTDSQLIFEKLSRSQQDAIKKTEEQVDYAEKTAGFQTSFLQKFEIYMQFFMNQFYNAIMGIWDTISDIPGLGGGEKKRQRELARTASRTGNSTLSQALGASGGNVWGFRDSLMKSQAMSDLSSKANPAFIEKVFGGESFNKGNFNANTGAVARAVEDALGQKEAGRISDLMAEAHEKDEAGAKLYYRDGKGKTLQTGIRANELKNVLTQEQMQKVFEKLGWHMSPEDLVKSFPEWEKTLGTAKAPEAKAPEAKAPEAKAPAQAAAPAAPTSGGTVTKPPEVKAQEATAKHIEAVQEAQVATTTAVGKVQDTLQSKGIQINQSHLNGDIKTTFREATFDAMEEALFDFALLTDQSKVLSRVAAAGGATGRGLFAANKELSGLGGIAAAAAGGGARPTAAPGRAAIPSVVMAAPTVAAPQQPMEITVHTTFELKDDLARYIARVADQRIVESRKATTRK